jgi:hypothetical protein
MATSVSNSFFSAMDSHASKSINYTTGENGAIEHSLWGMAPIGEELKGAFVGAFSGLVRGASQSRINDFVDNIISTIITKTPVEEHSTHLARLFVLMFQTRDIRGTVGKGERQLFYWMFLRMFKHYPEETLEFVEQIPHFGYWKDLNQIYAMCNGRDELARLKTEIMETYINQLQMDWSSLDGKINDHKLTLAAKWAPKEGRKVDTETNMARDLAINLFGEVGKEYSKEAIFHFRAKYRKALSRLNKEINTTEQLMCAGRFDDIKFRLVPGRALNKYKRAWQDLNKKGVRRHPDDETREECRKNYLQFLQDATKGKTTLKGKSMFVHELVEQIYSTYSLTDADKMLLEGQFNDHITDIRKHMEENNTGLDEMVAICDVSGSMSGVPMNVCIAMGIITSMLAKSGWQDRVITFHETPSWVNLRYPSTIGQFREISGLQGEFDPKRAGGELTLIEKVQVLKSAPWGMSTNFLKVFELLKNVAVANGIQLPKRLLVLSDMQFNEADKGGSYTTHHEIIKKSLEDAGLVMPEIIYWNLRGDTRGFPVQATTPNCQMLSGFATSQFKLFLTEGTLPTSTVAEDKPTTTPWDTFTKAVERPEYLRIHETLVQFGQANSESIFNGYVAPVYPETTSETD